MACSNVHWYRRNTSLLILCSSDFGLAEAGYDHHAPMPCILGLEGSARSAWLHKVYTTRRMGPNAQLNAPLCMAVTRETSGIALGSYGLGVRMEKSRIATPVYGELWRTSGAAGGEAPGTSHDMSGIRPTPPLCGTVRMHVHMLCILVCSL